MLDPAQYTLAEQVARFSGASWRYSQAHAVEHFERSGFPVRVSSLGQLAQVLDTMQENRFDDYMAELGGFSADELADFLALCRRFVDFRTTYFRRIDTAVPFSSLIAFWVIYHKLRSLHPGAQRILELGPGCGYLTLMMGQHDGLVDFSQAEAAQSFYLLQSLLARHVFTTGFDERAEVAPDQIPFADRPGDIETVYTLADAKPDARCAHYPWWRLGELAQKRFDLVTSNANLLEFSREALNDYLALIHQVLTPDGLFFAQCLGAPVNGTVVELLQRIKAANLAVVAFIPARMTIRGPAGERSFALDNLIAVPPGHPLHSAHIGRDDIDQPYLADTELVARFMARPADRQLYDRDQLLAKLAAGR